MITSLLLYEATGFDPYENLSIEQYLLETLQPGQCILYLWQNQNTVVIGRNQNPWVECRTSLLGNEDGKLARRLSGGGAVFHDLGNLNFTFLMSDEDFNIEKQLSVIGQACALTGIKTECSGRNDILAQGRKFSGNAFYHSRGHAYHHGTLLIRADMNKLQRYLNPSKVKLNAKGIASVRSRVMNLTELCPDLTITQMKANMQRAFAQIYGLPVQTLQLPDAALSQIAETKGHISSWEYLYGTSLPFTCQMEQHFSWGTVQLHIQAKSGIIQAVKMYTDAMDWSLSAAVEAALIGRRFTKTDMLSQLQDVITDKTVCSDLCQLIQTQDF